MSLPGTKVPPSEFSKNGQDSKLKLVSGAKPLKENKLQIGQPADISVAPPSRVYTRDYSKVGRSLDDRDEVSAVLGNPLGL